MKNYWPMLRTTASRGPVLAGSGYVKALPIRFPPTGNLQKAHFRSPFLR